MRLVSSLLFVSSALAQTSGDDASAIVERVAKAAESVKTLRIEGVVEESGSWSGAPAPFRLLMRAPDEVRFELNGGSTPAIILCNSENVWIYSLPLNRYRTLGASHCPPIVADWRSLPGQFKSLVLAGHRTMDVAGRTVDCQLVRGKSEALPPSSGEVKHELCIDTSNNTIAWEKDQHGGTSRTYTFGRIDRDIDLPPDTFEFQPPPGAVSVTYRLPAPAPLGSSAFPHDPDITLPKLLSKREPTYDDESRRARIEGTVILWVLIDQNGKLAEMYIFRHLSPGLDSSAISAVRRWRFAPATQAHQPIPYLAAIEVNFRLR